MTPGEIVVGMLELCNKEWTNLRVVSDEERRLEIAEEACFLVSTYYAGGMRGFEVPSMVVLTNLSAHFASASDTLPPAYIGIPLTGRFKGRGGVMCNLIIFVAQET